MNSLVAGSSRTGSPVVSWDGVSGGGAGGGGEPVEPLHLLGQVSDRHLRQRFEVGLRAHVELAGECGPRRGPLLADRDQLAVDVGHQVLGPEHVLLGGVAGLVTELGALDEVLREPAALAQDRLRALVEVEGVVCALDA